MSEYVSNKPSIQFKDIKPKKLLIANMVTINLTDGTIEYFDGYTPNDAAKVFWTAISDEYRKMLRWKEEHGDTS